MKLQIQVSMAGMDYVWKPGDVVTVENKAEAARLIEAGFAAPVVEAPEVPETPAPEKRGKTK